MCNFRKFNLMTGNTGFLGRMRKSGFVLETWTFYSLMMHVSFFDYI